jgi:hypothetical protein
MMLARLVASRLLILYACDQAKVLADGVVVDNESMPEVLLEAVMEFIESETGEGRGGAEADLAGVIQAGREEEIARPLAQRREQGREGGVDSRLRHWVLFDLHAWRSGWWSRVGRVQGVGDGCDHLCVGPRRPID